MASFAAQTIQSIFQKLSSDRLRRNEVKAGLGEGAMDEPTRLANNETEDAGDREKNLPHDICQYRTHTDLIDMKHDWIDSWLLNNESKNEGAVENAETERCETEGNRREDWILVEYILEFAVELEKHARGLLLGHMAEGSNARMLLKADRIVQLRNTRALVVREQSYPDRVQRTDDSSDGWSPCAPTDNGGKKSKASEIMRSYHEQEAELVPYPTDSDEQETLEETA